MAPPSRSNSPFRAASPGVKGQDKGGKGKSKGKGQSTNPIVPKHYCGKYLAGNCNGPDCMNPHIEHNVVDIMRAAWNKQKAAGISDGKGKKGKGKDKGKGKGKPAAVVVEQALESSSVKIEEVRD